MIKTCVLLLACATACKTASPDAAEVKGLPAAEDPCADSTARGKAERTLAELDGELRAKDGVKRLRVGACDAFWMANVQGLAHIAVYVPPVCGVVVTLAGKDELRAFAETLDGNAELEEKYALVCGEQAG